MAVLENRDGLGLTGYTTITRFTLSITSKSAEVNLTSLTENTKKLDLGSTSFLPVYENTRYNTLGPDPQRVAEKIKETYQTFFDDFLLEWRPAQTK